MDSSSIGSQGFLGLRCVRIPRCQNGFGFTLRHFIVYPPELYSEDGDADGLDQTNGRLHKVTEPVDTIFVKSVRDNSPAAYAGLCVGDRIVSVNGERIVGKSYDQVVSLIQKTRNLLCLEVSPKQYDTLQLFYEEQAYRPETNQRPYESARAVSATEPLYHQPVHVQQNSHYHPGSTGHLANDYAYSNRSYDTTDYSRLNNNNMSSSHSPAQFFSHLPRPVPYKSTSIWASSSTERNGDRNYLSSVSQSNTTNQPTQAQRQQQPQGYYPFNHSFDKSTILWKVRERDEPNSGAKSADSILGESGGDNAVYRSPLRSESMECLSELNSSSDVPWKKAGPGYRFSISTAKASGTSQPPDFRNTMVVTMSSTNNSRHLRDSAVYSDGGLPPVSGSTSLYSGYETQIVDRIRKSCEQKEEFLKRPNQPLWGPFVSQPPPPAFPKELYAQPQKFTKVPWPPENIMPAVSAPQQPLQSSVTDARNIPARMDKKSKSNNVTVISVQHSGPDSLSSGSSCRPESNSDSWSPVDRHSETDHSNDGHRERSKRDTYSLQIDDWVLPKNRTVVIGGKLHCDPPPDWKPDLATLTGYQQHHHQKQLPAIDSRLDESKGTLTLPTGSVETDIEVQTSAGNATENVILRRKELEPESESERLVRRVSYLKATSSPIDMERKSTSPTSPVKSFEVMSCKPTTFPCGETGRRRSMANKITAEFFPKGRIYKLKQFFEDRTQPTTSLFKFYVDSPTSDYSGLGIPPKMDKFVDSSEVVREGKIHFKIRIGENKRGTYNRSWRQGFAQVRLSGYLYLSKERLSKEVVTGNEESVIISVSIRDGVHIEHADDYTKRKHVLRIRTSFVPDDESNFPFSLATDNNTQNTMTSSSNTPTSSPFLTVEILLQCEDVTDLISWLNCIQRQLENNNFNSDPNNSPLSKSVVFGSEFYPKAKSFLTSFLPSPGTPGTTPTDRVGGSMSTSATTSNTLNPNVAVSSGGIASSASPKVKTWKGKVAKQWKKVHDIIDTSNTSGDNKSTSPYASLPPAGATFGINLENCPPGESNPFIPRVIEYSIELVEMKGIEMVGLYRIPGNNASVALLTERLNKGEDPNPERDPRWLDVHVVASLIKSFLRRLPDPLLTNDRYPAFIQAADEDETTCLIKIKELIKTLPPHNYETLKAVVMHLKHVAEKGEVNRMDARNLAIVFGPTIVRTAGENFSSMVADMKNQCKIVEALVLHADELFNVVETKSVPAAAVVLREQLPSDIIVVNAEESTKEPEIQQAIPTSSSPPGGTIENELKASLIKAAKRKVSAKENQPLFDEEKSELHDSKDAYKPVDEKGFIRSYAGLNEVTERRIRNFELETRAMLYRDDRSPNSSLVNVGTNKPIKGIEDIRQQQLKLDDALRKAKDDLEKEDIYDQIADNPSSIVYHRDRTLCASSPGPFNLSNSSLSSSNSNSTAPSLLTSSLPAWPTGSSSVSSNRLGPTPFRNSMPPQSLPPKPPVVSVSASLNASFDTVPGNNAQSQSPMRRVNSYDRIQGAQPSTTADVMSTFGKNDSFKRLRRPERKLSGGGANPKQLGGSLDSLNDMMANSRLHGPTKAGNDSSRDDISPRSSDGSDMVATLTKTLDKKLQTLRIQMTDRSMEGGGNSQIKAEPHNEALAHSDNTTQAPHHDDDNNLPGPNHFFKKGKRRHSLIERRKSSFDVQQSTKEVLSPTNADSKNLPESHSDSAKPANKPSSKKLAKECRRRHSLSGATDILSLMFRGSEKLSVHKDSETKKNKTLSSETLFSALKNANILESHV